jgi:DNA polymerase-3 subunit epsilon
MAVREIVFDTETTGLSPTAGDRIVEIGCVEMFNHIPTGNTFHVYLNPERDMPEAAFAVHGLSSAFLADKPVFATVADRFLEFVADGRRVDGDVTQPLLLEILDRIDGRIEVMEYTEHTLHQ